MLQRQTLISWFERAAIWLIKSATFLASIWKPFSPSRTNITAGMGIGNGLAKLHDTNCQWKGIYSGWYWSLLTAFFVCGGLFKINKSSSFRIYLVRIGRNMLLCFCLTAVISLFARLYSDVTSFIDDFLFRGHGFDMSCFWVNLTQVT